MDQVVQLVTERHALFLRYCDGLDAFAQLAKVVEEAVEVSERTFATNFRDKLATSTLTIESIQLYLNMQSTCARECASFMSSLVQRILPLWESTCVHCGLAPPSPTEGFLLMPVECASLKDATRVVQRTDDMIDQFYGMLDVLRELRNSCALVQTRSGGFSTQFVSTACVSLESVTRFLKRLEAACGHGKRLADEILKTCPEHIDKLVKGSHVIVASCAVLAMSAL